LRNADAHERNETRARGRFVGSRLPGDTFDRTRANFFAVLAEAFLKRISTELRKRRPAAGQKPEKRTDGAPTQGAREDALELLPRRHEANRPRERGELAAAVEVLDDFGDAEATQGNTDESHAVREKGLVEREALDATVDVRPDRSKQDADHGHRHAVEH